MAKVRHQVGIAGDINAIYRAMHKPSGLAGWWASAADGKPEEGEVINLHFEALTTLSFRIVQLQKNKLIKLLCVSGPALWRGSTLEFSFTQDEDQIWVGLVHENEASSDDEFLYFSTKWTCYLLSLRDLVENGHGRPYPHDVKISVND